MLAPATMGMSWQDFFDRPHRMAVRAQDRVGHASSSEFPWETHEEAEIVMEMSPQGEYNIYVSGWSVPAGESLTFDVYAEEQDWHCGWLTLDPGPGEPRLVWDCNANSHAVNHVDFYVDEGLVSTSLPFSNADYGHEYAWEIGGLGTGVHHVRAEAIGRAGGVETRTATIHIRRGERAVEVVRTVERSQTYFDIDLVIRNSGTLDIQLDNVVENMTGFQPFDVDGSTYDVTPAYDNATKTFDLTFDLFSTGHDYFLLSPGHSVTLHYHAAPVLLPDDTTDHVFGDQPVRVSDYWGTFYERIESPTLATADGLSLGDAVAAAQAAADYLVVTRPGALFSLFDGAAVHSLLQSMAELARYRTGVLGFLPSPCPGPDGVRDLILHWGEPMAGSDGTAGGYHENGYLVLVGEDEIVTSYDPDFDVAGFDNIQRTDMHYTNTSGWWVNPEIIISRIIGDSPAALEASIRTSLAVRAGYAGPGFRRDNALALAGDGDGWSYFHSSVEDVTEKLNDEFPTVSREKVRNIRDRGEDPAAWFRSNVADRNVIYYRDHCGNNSWTDVVGNGDFPLDFGATYPFAFACCCVAGRYEGGTIAETFTQNGAAVYIGATETSPRATNNDACLMFFNRWVDTSNTLGQAFRNLKRDLEGSYADYWSVEYQMYGDPKLGGSALTGASAAIATPVSEPPTSIHVTVPDYTVTQIDGYDHVAIPGGGLYLEPNRPAVPRFTWEQPLPAGYRVQEVTLASRSAPVTAEGLNLFAGIEAADAAAGGGHQTASTDDWWPAEPFRWEVEQHPNGTGTLRIHIYPFTYNPQTRQARFYNEYTFQASYTVSQVEITLAEQGPLGYGPGEEVAAVLWVENRGQPLNAVVSAVVRPQRPGGEVQGLSLRTLEGVQGLAHFPLRWETDGLATGEYVLEADVRDLDGNLLDSAVTTFQLGAVAAVAENLVVTPSDLQPGDPLGISFRLRNTGAVPISGTPPIQVLAHATGQVVAAFERAIGPVAPGASTVIQETWGTPAGAAGAYRISAYGLYAGRSTEPLVATVRTGKWLFLPLITQER